MFSPDQTHYTNSDADLLDNQDIEAPEISTSPINQTRFASEEPLFEQTEMVTTSTNAPGSSFVSRHKVPLLIASLMGGLLIFILVLVFLVSMTRQIIQPNDPLQPLQSPSVTTDPLQEEIETVRQELYDADPTKQEWPFPPVNMNVMLEDKK